MCKLLQKLPGKAEHPQPPKKMLVATSSHDHFLGGTSVESESVANSCTAEPRTFRSAATADPFAPGSVEADRRTCGPPASLGSLQAQNSCFMSTPLHFSSAPASGELLVLQPLTGPSAQCLQAFRHRHLRRGKRLSLCNTGRFRVRFEAGEDSGTKSPGCLSPCLNFPYYSPLSG